MVQCLLIDDTLIDSQNRRLCQLIDRAIVCQLIDTELIVITRASQALGRLERP